MGRAEDLFQRLIERGEELISELVLDRQSEELFLDFKRSADGGRGKKLHEEDRKNLAKAISGFGNSEGGIVVWGIDCRPDHTIGDVASCKVPIENPKRFKSWLEGAVSGCTIPPHNKVRHHAIESKSGDGFVVTYVAKSLHAPHQCLRPYPQYYIRAGSDFVPTPHSVLAGLFGKRPQPFVFPMWVTSPPKLVKEDGSKAIEFNFGIQLASHGPGIARDLYVNLLLSPPGEQTKVYIEIEKTNWTGSFVFGRIMQLVALDSFKLAPQAISQPMTVRVIFRPPFVKDIHFRLVFGHGSSPTQTIEKSITKENVNESYGKYLRHLEKGLEISIDDFMKDLLGIPVSVEDQSQESLDDGLQRNE